ncbi:hypothetical protein [Candidatus Neptunochlamydia vexilliferae]|uniref:Uncharacterized protein n=1 Tax=Candidatus Neptunichlamydia vexilliferae TaxID=1651774 RepID=A0ABS0AYZ5_9BACT|nr:hypothetical protein [Candidatus Neptunochlamydia vexilliferae]MBF5058837.1 hypothetical protein [Candidatus Neptunochlamydia vexilliferae]
MKKNKHIGSSLDDFLEEEAKIAEKARKRLEELDPKDTISWDQAAKEAGWEVLG